MKRSVTLLICTMLAITAFSQEEKKSDSYKNEVGIHAGFTTGVGLSYRHWINNNGIQITFIPIKTDEFRWISGGITFMHSFYESKYVRVYGYLGNHIYNYYSEYDNSYWDYETSEYIDRTSIDEDTQYNIGFGPGFSFGTVVAFNIMAGYGFYDVTGKFNMLPSAEMGLYYRF